MKPEKQRNGSSDARSGAATRDLDTRLNDLRSRISDEGQAIDEYKAKTAAAIGVGVFFGLLAAGAAYDLAFGKAGSWTTIGIDRSTLTTLAFGLGITSVLLLIIGILRQWRRDRTRESALSELEQEFAQLLNHKESRPEPR